MTHANLGLKGSFSPSIPTQFTTDNGIAIPSGNNLNIYGGSTSIINANGLDTLGTGDTADIRLTNRINTTTQTTDAASTTASNLTLDAVDGTYIFEGHVMAYNKTDDSAATFKIKGSVRSTAGVATEIGTEISDVQQEAGMETTSVELTVASNNFIVNVTGVAGKTINWRVYYLYNYLDGTA